MDIFKTIYTDIKDLLGLGDDRADEQLVINGIKSGVDFRGAKLWVLILAIFVASLGLNTNSTAVIIGAMLISPLMGPIIGMGLGMGIDDLSLFRRAGKSYLVATLFSVVTATLYFLLTPIDEAQSELLARTSPTIYDVLIALCGGLAGIIALGSSSQRTGNVIPGVAIATALMPPLCTVGFSIATGNWAFAAGALFLYLINTVFISLATYVGCRFILNLKPVVETNEVIRKRTNRIIFIITALVIIPATMLTVRMIQESLFQQRARNFITHELNFTGTQVLMKDYNYESQTIHVALLGKEIDSLRIADARNKLTDYNLDKVTLEVVQNQLGLDSHEVENMITKQDMRLAQAADMVNQQKEEVKKLEMQLENYQQRDKLSSDLYREIKSLYPTIQEISVGLGANTRMDSVLQHSSTTLIYIRFAKPITTTDREKLDSWLRQRANYENLQIVVESGK